MNEMTYEAAMMTAADKKRAQAIIDRAEEEMSDEAQETTNDETKNMSTRMSGSTNFQ